MNTKLIRYRSLWKWLHGYKRTLATVLLSSLLVTFLGMNWPFVYRHIINQVFYDKSLDKLNFILTVYALLFVTEKILQLIWRLADAVIASDFLYSIREHLYEKILSLNMASKESYSSGQLLDILNHDVDQIYTFLVDEGVFAVTCFVRLLMAVIYIYLINRLATVFIIILVMVNYFLSAYLKKKFMVHFKAYKKSLEKYHGFLLDILAGLKEIKLLSAVGYAKDKVTEQLAVLGDLKKKQMLEEAWQDIFHDGLYIFSEMILYGAAAYEILKGRMLLGDFVSLMIYYEWAKIFFRIFARFFVGASKSFVSLDRINRLMEEESEPAGTPGDIVTTGDILFEHVTFQYRENTPVLKDIHFKIPSGSITALAGASGSGKSTIAGLLLKLYEPCQGTIWIGNRPFSQISPKAIRAKIGIVHQNANLLEGTIRKNLLMGKPDASEQELWNALKAAHADEFVCALPFQLDTGLTLWNRLSTGQCQRIALARLFLKNPDIIILDEATSNIDPTTEKKFLQDAAKIFKEKTVIIIAYRTNSLEIADNVLYLESGRLRDMGTHRELLASNSKYKALISSSQEEHLS